nr:hypothetical protein [Tanacetum cinerariifolium]
MEEEGERYFTPCYVGGLHAYDGEINLKYEKNLISNEFAVKLCFEYEKKIGEKLLKRELLVSLKGEFYFVKFIVNPKEDDVEPSVIIGRSFMRLTKGIANFGNGIITIHPELDPFLDNSEVTKKFKDDWDHLLDIDFGDIQKIYIAGLLHSSEEATREALAIDICKRFSVLEEERPVIKTMVYSDKYKKILDGIVMDNLKLDGEIKKEEEEAIILETKINLNALAEIDSDINVMPFRIYAKLGREEVKKVNRGITMLNHSMAEPIGVLKDVLCQVGVTTIIEKFLILDIPIYRDASILVGRGFLYTCGSIPNTRDRITSTFDGVCHHTFYVTKTSLNTEESDGDDEEDYGIQRNNFGAPIYGPKPAKYLNCNDSIDQALALQEFIRTHDDEAGSSSSPPKRARITENREEALIGLVLHEFLLWGNCNMTLKNKYVRELCHKFNATFEFDEAMADDELMMKKAIKFRLCGKAYAMSILDFAKRLGLYTGAEIQDYGFETYFIEGLRNDDDFSADQY